MSRLVIHARYRQESVATAIVDLSPGQPVRSEIAGGLRGEVAGGSPSEIPVGPRVLSDVLQLERPLPLAALVRHVLTRYGLEPTAETDCAPCAAAESCCREPERGALRA